MTLNTIQFPAFVIIQLYKNCLVESQSHEKITTENAKEITFLGRNNKHILLLVNNCAMTFLPDSELEFLLGILSACKLSLEDIAIVNQNKLPSKDQKILPELLNAETIIIFGKSTTIDLPFNIPEFQVQSFKNRKYLFAPALEVIQTNLAVKRKLWEMLKKIFNL